jgi:hypothetical protein
MGGQRLGLNPSSSPAGRTGTEDFGLNPQPHAQGVDYALPPLQVLMTTLSG